MLKKNLSVSLSVCCSMWGKIQEVFRANRKSQMSPNSADNKEFPSNVQGISFAGLYRELRSSPQRLGAHNHFSWHKYLICLSFTFILHSSPHKRGGEEGANIDVLRPHRLGCRSASRHIKCKGSSLIPLSQSDTQAPHEPVRSRSPSQTPNSCLTRAKERIPSFLVQRGSSPFSTSLLLSALTMTHTGGKKKGGEREQKETRLPVKARKVSTVVKTSRRRQGLWEAMVSLSAWTRSLQLWNWEEGRGSPEERRANIPTGNARVPAEFPKR